MRFLPDWNEALVVCGAMLLVVLLRTFSALYLDRIDYRPRTVSPRRLRRIENRWRGRWWRLW